MLSIMKARNTLGALRAGGTSRTGLQIERVSKVIRPDVIMDTFNLLILTRRIELQCDLQIPYGCQAPTMMNIQSGIF